MVSCSTFLKQEATTRNIQFSMLRSLEDIAKEYSCDARMLEHLLQLDHTIRYEEKRLRKKNPARRGEYRLVYKARFQPFSNLHKNIATSIAMQCYFPDYVQGFVGRRSIVSNASMHLAKPFVLKADIRNFFESITSEQVKTAFMRLGCNDHVAEIFTELCTTNGFLPQGAATSPILSNLVCEDMDRELNALGNKCGATYSRYADDITFSGEAFPAKSEVEHILNQNGFQMHPDKYYLAKRGRAQYVTGLSVFDNVRPHVAKRMKRRLRLELYYIEKNGIEGHLKRRLGIDSLSTSRISKECARITGWIDFICMVESDKVKSAGKKATQDAGEKLKAQWIRILGDPRALRYFRRHRIKPRLGFALKALTEEDIEGH